MKIDAKKVISCLEELYQCGTKDDGTHTRMAFSKEDVKGRETFMGYFEELGIPTRVDEAGNIIARLEGTDPTLPAILIGSHLDTVPDGGRYDGVLGCVSGYGVCEALVKAETKLRHPLEVIVFTDEEGFRFGNGLLGSSAISGIDPEVRADDMDLYGQPRSEVMKSYGIKVENVKAAKKDRKDVHCFIELHVEQGASLDKTKTSIGVVSSIAGVSRYEVILTGEANHAGSTTMADRKDALIPAAAFIAKVPQVVKELGNEFTVATVGTIKVEPNSVNVVPGECDFQLEIRDQDAKIISLIEDGLKELLEGICKESAVPYTFRPISYHEPAPMSDWVEKAIEKAVQKTGYDYRVLPSGAFHDALIMSAAFPTGMIFVPSVNGISHSRYEVTHDEDIAHGCEVLMEAIMEVDHM